MNYGQHFISKILSQRQILGTSALCSGEYLEEGLGVLGISDLKEHFEL